VNFTENNILREKRQYSRCFTTEPDPWPQWPVRWFCK